MRPVGIFLTMKLLKTRIFSKFCYKYTSFIGTSQRKTTARIRSGYIVSAMRNFSKAIDFRPYTSYTVYTTK